VNSYQFMTLLMAAPPLQTSLYLDDLAAVDPHHPGSPGHLTRVTAKTDGIQLEADASAIPTGPAALVLLGGMAGLLALLIWPDSPLRRQLMIGLKDFFSLFGSLRGPRHVIHDQPYLDRVLEAEFQQRSPRGVRREPASSPTPNPDHQEPDHRSDQRSS
jgi:hypothetical protein